MKILGPNNEVLAEKGKLMFVEVTCGQCAHGKPKDQWSVTCCPTRPIWERDKFPPVVSERHRDEPADGCECFKRKPEESP